MMNFDFKGERFERWLMFCRQVVKIKQSPDIIAFVASETEHVLFCRNIIDADDKFQKQFDAMCRTNQMDPDDIRRQMQLVALALRISKQVDYYNILGVSHDADEQTIKKAYRKKARIFHPDIAAGKDENGREFVRLHDAYKHLRDPKMRRHYDQLLGAPGYWVEGKKSSQISVLSIGFGRFVSWMFVLIGFVVMAAYAFDIYRNESNTFFSGKLLSNKLKEPESILKNEDDEEVQAKAVKIFAIKMPPENGDSAFETEFESAVVPEYEVNPNSRTVQRASAKTSEKRISRTLNKTAIIENDETNADKRIKAKEVDYAQEKQRLLAFIEIYTRTYEQKDLNRFITFFTQDALEQGRPFKEMLPTYRKTFSQIDALRYHIDMQSFILDSVEKKIMVEGAFRVAYRMPEKDWGNSSGSIRMELSDRHGRLMVSRLEYEMEER